MVLSCPSCGADVPPDRVELAVQLAWCPTCERASRVALVAGDAVPAPEAPAPPDPSVGLAALAAPPPLPDELDVLRGPAGLEVRYRWFQWIYLLLGFFALVWNGILVVLYGGMIAMEEPGFMLLFPLAHVVVGAGIAYVAVTGLVNHTVVTVGGGAFRVAHGPLPWPGNRTIAAVELEQLSCGEQVHQGDHGTTVTYKVLAALTGGRTVTLLFGLPSLEVVQAYERLVEDALGIVDRPVPGEVA